MSSRYRRHVIFEYNIEGDPMPDLLDLAMEIRPAQFTLVPVEPGEITSHHGWNIQKDEKILSFAIERLKKEGIRVSLFMDADASCLRSFRVQYLCPLECGLPTTLSVVWVIPG
ncbi:MAG: pyridoxine 5'-phosphate synthase [Desulfobacterales bacterium]